MWMWMHSTYIQGMTLNDHMIIMISDDLGDPSHSAEDL